MQLEDSGSTVTKRKLKRRYTMHFTHRPDTTDDQCNQVVVDATEPADPCEVDNSIITWNDTEDFGGAVKCFSRRGPMYPLVVEQY